jgi:hypothetical protein
MKKPTHPTRTKNQDDLEQSRAFIEKAGEIGTDEDASRADELVGSRAKMPPEPTAANRFS